MTQLINVNLFHLAGCSCYIYRMNKLIAVMICSLIIGGVQAQKVSQPRKGVAGQWRFLGMVTAQTVKDHDIIVVAGPYDFFRRLKFKVTDSPIEMAYMLVRYQDGGAPERIETRFNIPQGGESRVIDIKGGARKLKSVEFWYRDKGLLNGKADVSLLGQK